MAYQPPYGSGPPVMHDPYAVMAPPGADYSYLGGPPQYQSHQPTYEMAPAPVPKPLPLMHGGGGGGGGYHGSHHAAAAAAAARSTSNVNTNSKDPALMKSRVFVGNLNTNIVAREEVQRVFASFGEILAISMHKGYAFVQFGYESEARNAVSFTDGTMLGGKRVDVTVASEPKTAGDSSSGVNKRSANVTITLGGTPDAKRQKITPSITRPNNPLTKRLGSSNASTGANKAYLSIVNKAKAATRVSAVTDGGVKLETLENGEDIIICGKCRFLFKTIELFSAHKKGDKCYAPPAVERAGNLKVESDPEGAEGGTADSNGADAEVKPIAKADGEPPMLQCFICHDKFERSWNLLVHINQKHSMKVYEVVEDGDNNSPAPAVKK